MPHFYFDVDDGGMITPPVQGFEFADPEAARLGLIDTLARTAAIQPPTEDGSTQVIGTLVDDAGASLLNVILTLQSVWL